MTALLFGLTHRTRATSLASSHECDEVGRATRGHRFGAVITRSISGVEP